MTTARKVTMAAYGVGGSLFGIFYLFFPEQSSAMQGAEAMSAYLIATKMTLGASLVAVGAFTAIAARDPIANILWLRFAISFALLFLAVALYSGAVLFDSLSRASVGIVIHGLFAGLLIAVYPWRAADRAHARSSPIPRPDPGSQPGPAT